MFLLEQYIQIHNIMCFCWEYVTLLNMLCNNTALVFVTYFYQNTGEKTKYFLADQMV